MPLMASFDTLRADKLVVVASPVHTDLAQTLPLVPLYPTTVVKHTAALRLHV